MLLIVSVVLLMSGVGYRAAIGTALIHFHRARASSDELMKATEDLLRGIKELKLHRERREEFTQRHLRDRAGRLRAHNLAGYTIYGIASGLGECIAFILLVTISLIPPRILLVDRSSLMGIVLALVYVVGPIQVVLNTFPQLGRAKVAANSIANLGMALKGADPDAESSMASAAAVGQSFRSLDLVDVAYKYSNRPTDDQFGVGPVNVRFEAGTIVFVTGGNGSGKTTLAKLITGLYQPDSGTVLINGLPVRQSDREAYRQNFAAVFSDFYLFHDLLGLTDSRVDDRAKDYLRKLGLHNKVAVSDRSLSTLDLSLGQRKRLALLTAYLEDRAIYLFDEWAADQDPHFREIFYREILTDLRARGKLVIVISHDDRFYSAGDRLIKLEAGTVASDTEQ